MCGQIPTVLICTINFETFVITKDYMTDKCIPCVHLVILLCTTGVLRRMAVILCHLLLTLLLSGQGLCQCYSQSSCAGDVVTSSDQRDCCVSQNGLSYNDTGTCTPCIGMLVMSASYTQCLTKPVCSCSTWIPSECVQCQ